MLMHCSFVLDYFLKQMVTINTLPQVYLVASFLL